MIKLNEILNINQVEQEILDGYVNRRTHPEFPNLAILNYAEKTAYEDHWNDVTLTCRGLIYDMDSLEVLARPFPKFFNWGDERHVVDVDLDAPIIGAFDKVDGSLGIGYVRPDGKAAIATRGSFESEQATHATERLSEDEAAYIQGAFSWNHTALYEIIFPENRIVLDYGDRDEMVPLGTVRIDTGECYPNHRLASKALTLREVLALPVRENAEGYVIWLDPFTAVKLKQDDYVALHKIVTGLNRKSVWRALMEGTFAELIEQLPDEFYKWAEEVEDELGIEFMDYMEAAEWAAREVQDKGTRKDQALWIVENIEPDHRGLVFALLDGKNIEQAIWRKLEPQGSDR